MKTLCVRGLQGLQCNTRRDVLIKRPPTGVGDVMPGKRVQFDQETWNARDLLAFRAYLRRRRRELIALDPVSCRHATTAGNRLGHVPSLMAYNETGRRISRSC
jgi:hypothetical protein